MPRAASILDPWRRAPRPPRLQVSYHVVTDSGDVGSKAIKDGTVLVRRRGWTRRARLLAACLIAGPRRTTACLDLRAAPSISP
jgi:hypothetical protein